MPRPSPLTWKEIQNWWPIVGALIAVTLYFTGWLMTLRIELAEQRRDLVHLTETIQEDRKEIKAQDGRLQIVERIVSTLRVEN